MAHPGHSNGRNGGNGNGAWRGGSTLPRGITSAYNFAPLAQQVVCPEWQDRVSHDLPLREGLCADLQIELVAETPLLVGAERDDTPRQRGQVPAVGFHTHPDGTPAIPGSSLRGMLRNVLEIASFSRMQLIDDRALSIRDLTTSGSEYMRAMVGGDIRSSSVGARPLAQGGWLWFDGQDWRLEPTSVARVEHREIVRHFGLSREVWPGKRTTAAQKYEVLRTALQAASRAGKLTKTGHVQVRHPRVEEAVHERSRGKQLRYRRIERLLPVDDTSPSSTVGALVVTGQGVPNKHMEFVFGLCGRKPESRVIDPAAMTRFRQVYGHDDSDWSTHWSRRAAEGTPVPVFWIERDGELQIGLSQMFRLPGPRSLGQMVPDEHRPRAGAARRLDFVETLFGRVGSDAALKGRVFVGDLRWSGSPQGRPVPADAAYAQPTVLGQPKPSFYPAYLEQQQQGGVLKSPDYRTVLSPDARLRGWKRYPVRPLPEVRVPEPPAKSQATVQTRLQALAPGNRFKGRIRLHNVTPEELGAVAWALTWGGDDRLRHAIGLGKAFGFGCVRVRIANADSPDAVRANDPATSAPGLGDCTRAFVAYMQRQIPGWERTGTMCELLAMANPELPQATAANLTPLELTVGARNEFVEAKSRDNRLALQPHSQRR